MALRAMRSSALRSALTALGVIIGVATFITTLALGAGSQQAVTQRVESLGTNLVTAFPGFGSGATFTIPMAQQLAHEVPDVTAAMPVLQGRAANIAFGATTTQASVQGVSQDWPAMHGVGMAEGTFFTAAELASSAPVAVLGQTVLQDLGIQGSAVGQTIFVNGYPFTVTGVLQSIGAGGGFAASNQDDVVLLPYTSAEVVLDTVTPAELVFQVKAPQDADLVVGTLNMIFNHLFPPAQPGVDAVTVSSQNQLLNTLSATTQTLQVTLSAIAAVSLLVGGIGIMNIMLVSVTERTREIGLRKAIGAKRRDILLQFLLEAALTSAAGGLIGIALGQAGSVLVGKALKTLTLPTLQGALLGFGFAVAVGLVFGFWPAAQGSRLDPIEALRHD
jgi:putative ABC transport system permease protein